MSRKLRLPSPALAVALAALFVALSGTAVAASVVPLAKRALTADKAKVADNSKKLEGKTSAQLLATANTAAKAAAEAAAQQPGPASTAAGLIVTKTASIGQLGPGQFREGSITCDAGAKVTGGGFSSDGIVLMLDSFPSNDTTWNASGLNLVNSPANASIWAVCIK